MQKLIIDFIIRSKAIGKSSAEIRELLLSAGWSAQRVDIALAQFVDSSEPIAIPRRSVECLKAVNAGAEVAVLDVLRAVLNFLLVYAMLSLISVSIQAYFGVEEIADYERAGVPFSIAALTFYIALLIWINRRTAFAVGRFGRESNMFAVASFYAGVTASFGLFLSYVIRPFSKLIGGEFSLETTIFILALSGFSFALVRYLAAERRKLDVTP